jgi:TRAP-type transport system periplasmic protein
MNMTWLGRSVLTAGIAAAIGIGLVSAASALTLKAAHYLPPKHPIHLGYQTFAEEVKKNTNGAVTIRIFPGESLLGAKAISDGIRDRVADLGFDTLTYTPSYYPHGMLLNDLSMIGENDMAAAFAIDELFMLHCRPCQIEFEKQNQIFLSSMSTPPYVLVVKGDVNSLEKIKGKKLRAGGPLWDRFAQSVGATGVNIPSSEMFEAMSRGILDGTIYSVGGLKTHGLADVATQVVTLNLGSFRAGNLYSFNRDAWSELSVDQRRAVFRAITAAVVRTINEYHKGEEEAVVVGNQKKIPIVQPDPALQKAKDDFVESDLPIIIDNANKKLGIADAAEFVKQYRDLYAKYEKLVTPLQKDPGKLSELLYTEVYAKLDPAKYGVK